MPKTFAAPIYYALLANFALWIRFSTRSVHQHFLLTAAEG